MDHAHLEGGGVKATKHHNYTKETLTLKIQIYLIDKNCDTVYTKVVNFSSKGVDCLSMSRCNCQSLQLEHFVWKLVSTQTISVDLTLSAVKCYASTCPFSL